MRIIFILALCLSIALAFRSVKSGPKNFPPQFTAYFNETDLLTWYYPNSMKTLYYDAVNKRARETAPGSANGKIEDRYLLYQAPGAEPGSHAANGYTQFVLNPAYPEYVPNNCYYKSVDGDGSSPFDQIWWTVAPTGPSSVYDFMFEYPDDMAYVGVEFINELGVYADRWDSVKRCNLVRSGYGEIACTTVFQSRDQNQYTLKQIRAHAASGSFDTDLYLVRVFHSFKPSVSDGDFALPQSWPVACGYADSGFNFSQYTTIWAGATNSNFTFSLKAPPVQGLGGTVKVSLIMSPTWYYNCTNCVTMSEQTLFFDTTNWNVPQYVWLNYVSTGCEQLKIHASGGGYDWQYETHYNYLVFESCHYDPVSGFCKEDKICGEPN